MFDEVIKLLKVNGFQHYMPGARLTGFICFYRRPNRWLFWKKEWVFLLKGQWLYSGVNSEARWGAYETMAKDLFGEAEHG